MEFVYLEELHNFICVRACSWRPWTLPKAEQPLGGCARSLLCKEIRSSKTQGVDLWLVEKAYSKNISKAVNVQWAVLENGKYFQTTEWEQLLHNTAQAVGRLQAL